ncbi:MAG: hypothetical protein FWD48_08540 [Oscillospiraceae bacterium]|nr:hypothetical protein [Oscillospiraceae bacterium]
MENYGIIDLHEAYAVCEKLKKDGKNMKKFRKIISCVMACIILLSAGMIQASSCTNSYHTGTVWYSGTNLRIGVNSSAMNSILTFNVYNSVTTSGGWNNLHTPARIHISNVIHLGAAPSATRDIDVVAWYYGSSNKLGEVVPYDSFGNVTGEWGNWSSAVIRMTDCTSIWGDGGVSATIRTERARKTFIHEVGHVFRLSHPNCSNISGPLAVMRQEAADLSATTSATVVTHDENNIAARWR